MEALKIIHQRSKSITLSLTYAAPFLGIFGLFIAFIIYKWVAVNPTGTDLMKKIEGYIRSGDWLS